jgi:MarR family transcriptional regulator for hemolysin
MATQEKIRDTATDSPHCLGGNLSWLLSQAYFSLASEMSAAFAPLGVSARGYNVLSAALTGDFTQTELADLVGLDKTTMVVTIDELEEAGLAERRPSSKDRRARVIGVTKAGKRKVAESEQLVDRIQTDVLETLPPRERRVFLDALGSLVKGRLGECVDCSPPLRRREPRA